MSEWADERGGVRIHSDRDRVLSTRANVQVMASPLAAKHIALLYSRAAHAPRKFERVPCVASTFADGLSIMFEPGADTKLPPQLSDATYRTTPRRKRPWYKSLAAN